MHVFLSISLFVFVVSQSLTHSLTRSLARSLLPWSLTQSLKTQSHTHTHPPPSLSVPSSLSLSSSLSLARSLSPSPSPSPSLFVSFPLSDSRALSLSHFLCLCVPGKKRICKHQPGHVVQRMMTVMESRGRGEWLADVVEGQIVALQSTSQTGL